MRTESRCVRVDCPNRKVAFRLCSRHWLELCDRAHVDPNEVAFMHERTS